MYWGKPRPLNISLKPVPSELWKYWAEPASRQKTGWILADVAKQIQQWLWATVCSCTAKNVMVATPRSGRGVESFFLTTLTYNWLMMLRHGYQSWSRTTCRQVKQPQANRLLNWTMLFMRPQHIMYSLQRNQCTTVPMTEEIVVLMPLRIWLQQTVIVNDSGACICVSCKLKA